MKVDIDALPRLRALVAAEGSQRAAAKRLGITDGYICDILAGRREFSASMLAKLGLRRTVIEATR